MFVPVFSVMIPGRNNRGVLVIQADRMQSHTTGELTLCQRLINVVAHQRDIHAEAKQLIEGYGIRYARDQLNRDVRAGFTEALQPLIGAGPGCAPQTQTVQLRGHI